MISDVAKRFYPQPAALTRVLVIIALGALLSSCQTTVSGPVAGFSATPNPSVLLSSGDLLRFTFIGSPELNGAQKIRADGRLNLPLIGEVQAAGKTVTALQADLSTRYKAQLQTTDVLVTLEKSEAQVIVSGAVTKPGKVAFERPTTVLQAIMEAGGANAYGNLRNVRLIRTSNGQQHARTLDVNAAMMGISPPFYVRDGDIIYIPQSIF